MAQVSFIGLGAMGFALADTAAKFGREIVVWNRTSDKALPLAVGNVTVAATPAEAISASPMVVVCVSDYATTASLLATPECMAALKGRILIQLSSGSPTLSRSASDWAKRAGAAYLDGEIVAYPNQIGGDEFPLLLAGDKAAYDAAEPLLKEYTPQARYLGSDPAKSSALNLAALSGSLGMTIGIMNGAALCEAAGISLQELVRDLPTNTAYDAQALMGSLRKIENGGLDSSDAPIGVWVQIADLMIEFQQETGYRTDVSAFARQLFGRAVDLGLATNDVGSLLEMLRPNRP
ncbi:MAG: NAD(P)-binding domain-containing protein [Gammaproteobacteria bacterium]|nr:NAD(P)-binding domain-containing protein [Gammaproteobacteria bacterium]